MLLRRWSDARAGGGCCGGEVRDGVCLDRADRPDTHEVPHDDPVAAAYRRLREELPGVDVEVADAGNAAYLLPTTFRAVRRRAGPVAALRAAARATTPGGVLVDGELVGDVETLGADGVVALVRSELAAGADPWHVSHPFGRYGSGSTALGSGHDPADRSRTTDDR